ncbi:MAG TPA: VOC family protein [Kofleriaceae bacterium]|nr:VOC family protein [Kofleriaceae bacterium]
MAKIPEGHHTVTPGLVVEDVDRLIQFMRDAFGAEQTERFDLPNGHVAHAEVKIGDAVIMMGEPAPPNFPAMPTMLSLYVDDVDSTYEKALAAGAESLSEPADQFYGHRIARVRDPAGNKWSLHTVVEEVSADELRRRVEHMDLDSVAGAGGAQADGG